MKSPSAPLLLSRRCLMAAALIVGLVPDVAASPLAQTNLVSDIPGLARYLDPNLTNPWGIAESGGSPFWIADNQTGLSTLYNTQGTPLSLVVTIPPPSGGAAPSAPTGIVFNGDPSAFGGARFIFSTEDGTIAAWSGGTSAALQVDNSLLGDVYKGLAGGLVGTDSFLYATDFTSGAIDVFDSTFVPVTLSGAFADPNLPAGYAPFGIRNIGGNLYVTYAVRNGEDDLPGPGLGIVDVFDTGGNLLQRLINPGGALNAPWGLTLAPAGFAQFGGALLVGNFGDGTINAFDPVTGALLGTLTDIHGNPIVNEGLWALQFGNGGPGGLPNVLYLTAGLNDEENGLFAQIAAPEPMTLALMGVAIAGLAFVLGRKSR